MPRQSLKNQRKLSRSKIDLFIECQRCFYLDQKLGVKKPSIPAFTLNSAVDHLLKKEFDIHRAGKRAHPLMSEYGIKAIPFEHPDMEKWRHNFTGIQYQHSETGFLIFGAIDDLWINDSEELHVVDYKATSKNEAPNLDGRWQQAYKRQMEIYQWLFRKNGFKVSDLGYFVYVNGRRDKKSFDGRLEFNVDIISYKGSDRWVEKTILEIFKLLEQEKIPDSKESCEHCAYRKNSALAIKKLYPHTFSTIESEYRKSDGKKGVEVYEKKPSEKNNKKTEAENRTLF